MLQSLHRVHRQTIMGVATADVGMLKSPPAHHARFMAFYNKTCKNMLLEMHQYDIKNMSL